MKQLENLISRLQRLAILNSKIEAEMIDQELVREDAKELDSYTDDESRFIVKFKE